LVIGSIGSQYFVVARGMPPIRWLFDFPLSVFQQIDEWEGKTGVTSYENRPDIRVEKILPPGAHPITTRYKVLWGKRLHPFTDKEKALIEAFDPVAKLAQHRSPSTPGQIHELMVEKGIVSAAQGKPANKKWKPKNPYKDPVIVDEEDEDEDRWDFI
jgi:hypothetical protein